MDGVVSGLVINKLDTLIQKEVNLVCGAKKKFKTLRDELRLLQPFISGIYNQNSDSDELVQELVKQLHEVSCDAEDAIDLYLYDNYKGLEHWAKKLICAAVPNLYRRRQLSIRAQGIKEAINRILDLKQKYNLLDGSTSTATHIQQAANVPMSLNVKRILVAEGDDVVGFEEASSHVIKKLIPLQHDGMERRAISIIGMGGLGKTTLAKKIYNNKDVAKHFTTKVWVVVSQDKNICQLLACILKAFDKNMSLDEHDIDDLKNKLGNKLENGRYLIALDDIWDPELCKGLHSCLPADPKNGSRILLTTRSKEVANSASKEDSDTHEIKPLGKDDSWLLFCKVALKGNACPDNLVTTGEDLVSKCKGLPLAITVLGGVLSTAEMTPSFGRWYKFLDDRSWQQRSGCYGILSLSYQCLPVHLKTCFLYVGVFPEDYEIHAEEICLLWITEGFIPCQEDEEMDVAERYLVDLANRHLITVSELGFDGGIESFRIHDMLRDFCIKEAGKCYLYEVDGKGTFAGVTEVTRRLIVTSCKSEVNIPFTSLQRLRTLFVFDMDAESRLELSHKCDENLAVARILHIEKETNRIEIKKLVLLKYLSVSLFSFNSISIASLCKMLNLQILCLSGCGEDGLSFPSGFWNLKHLKQFKVFPIVSIPDARSADDVMLYLQTLSSIELEEHTLKLIREVKFPKLRNIYIINYRHQPVKETILPSLLSLPLLKSLMIRFVYVIPLVGAFSPTLTNITLISLRETALLTSDQWMLLGKLENLLVLELFNFKLPTASFEFKAGAFPQLISFILESGYCHLEIADGALNTLQYLNIIFSTEAEHQEVNYKVLELQWSVHQNWISTFRYRHLLESFGDATVDESVLHFNDVLKGTSAVAHPKLQKTTLEQDDDQQVGWSKIKGDFVILEETRYQECP